MKTTPESTPVKETRHTEGEYLAFFAECIEEGKVVIFGSRVVNFKLVDLVSIRSEDETAIIFAAGDGAHVNLSDINL